MPSMNLFKRQPKEYQEQVLPKNAKIITVEAGSTMCWNYFTKYTIGINEFGTSAPRDDVLERLHFDYESILSKIEEYINEDKDNYSSESNLLADTQHEKLE